MAQRGEITCPKAHRHKWQSQDRSARDVCLIRGFALSIPPCCPEVGTVRTLGVEAPGRLVSINTFTRPLYSFLVAVVTDHCRFSDLKKHKFILF